MIDYKYHNKRLRLRVQELTDENTALRELRDALREQLEARNNARLLETLSNELANGHTQTLAALVGDGPKHAEAEASAALAEKEPT